MSYCIIYKTEYNLIKHREDLIMKNIADLFMEAIMNADTDDDAAKIINAIEKRIEELKKEDWYIKLQYNNPSN